VTILRAAMVGGGVALVVLTARSIVGTLIVPRGLSSWISRAVGRVTRAPFVFVADRCTRYETKDRVLAPQAPLTLLALLLCWLGLFLVAYTALVFGLSDIGLGEALRQAGSSMFTLGFDTSRQADVTALEFAAAATGPLVIALQIAYLPTIYAAYNRRETDVTLLQSRAGEPAWGPEVLARHRLVNILDSLPEFYRGWERWAADVAESHTNYPSLIDFRSPRPLRSWVVGLLAVLDSAALYLAIAPSRAPSEARLCLRMGFTCLREICDALRLSYDPDPRPDLLPPTGVRRVPRRRTPVGGGGVPDGADAGGGMGALPRLAGQLRGDGLCADGPARCRAGPVVGLSAAQCGGDGPGPPT